MRQKLSLCLIKFFWAWEKNKVSPNRLLCLTTLDWPWQHSRLLHNMLYCVPMYTSLFTNQVHYLSNYSEGYVQLGRFLCNYVHIQRAVYSTTQEYITYLSRSITKSSSSIMHGTGNWVKYVLDSCFNFSTNIYIRT